MSNRVYWYDEINNCLCWRHNGEWRPVASDCARAVFAVRFMGASRRITAALLPGHDVWLGGVRTMSEAKDMGLTFLGYDEKLVHPLAHRVRAALTGVG